MLRTLSPVFEGSGLLDQTEGPPPAVEMAPKRTAAWNLIVENTSAALRHLPAATARWLSDFSDAVRGYEVEDYAARPKHPIDLDEWMQRIVHPPRY